MLQASLKSKFKKFGRKVKNGAKKAGKGIAKVSKKVVKAVASTRVGKDFITKVNKTIKDSKVVVKDFRQVTDDAIFGKRAKQHLMLGFKNKMTKFAEKIRREAEK